MKVHGRLDNDIKDLKHRVMKIESIESIHNVFSEYSLKMDLGLWSDVSNAIYKQLLF